MAEQRGPEVRAPELECDIVMKGGITSGVLYPSAVHRLAERYRFRSVGGASVGAIAAAVTAAAEYGRQTGNGTGFGELQAMNEEMAREGFLVSLFKPQPSATGVYSIYLAVIGKQGMARTARTVIGQALWVILPLLAWWGTLAVTALLLGERWWAVPAFVGGWALPIWAVVGVLTRRLGLAGLLAGILLAHFWPLALAVPSVGLQAWRVLSENGFGLVPGSSPDGDALCDWLHRHIQRAAGLDDDQPLTFGRLRNDEGRDGKPVGVDLQMMTTNLSTARPMRLPRQLTGYAFHPEDLRGVLPGPVIEWLSTKGTREGELVRLPGEDDLPVLLGFRMSLSFPVLFTAVRLRASAPETLSADPVDHWFSDGGIASNFPIHFFDAWVPGRPTFGLSFAPFPLDRHGRVLPDESDVGLPPGPDEPSLPRWVRVERMGGFVAQILETMQNWRDTLQQELPGFRDRVYEARLDKEQGEGGLNLGMDAPTIERLQNRGGHVADAILKTFDWDQHFFTRYLVAMQQLELGLLGDAPAGGRSSGVRESFAERREQFAAGEVGAGELFGREPAWLPPAGRATWDLVTLAEGWEAFGRFVSDRPRPRPVMRVIPDV
jgi:hypothetical protein